RRMSLTFAASLRATTSVVPPGGKGTTMRTVLSGNAACASVAAPSSSAPMSAFPSLKWIMPVSSHVVHCGCRPLGGRGSHAAATAKIHRGRPASARPRFLPPLETRLALLVEGVDPLAPVVGRDHPFVRLHLEGE